MQLQVDPGDGSGLKKVPAPKEGLPLPTLDIDFDQIHVIPPFFGEKMLQGAKGSGLGGRAVAGDLSQGTASGIQIWKKMKFRLPLAIRDGTWEDRDVAALIQLDIAFQNGSQAILGFNGQDRAFGADTLRGQDGKIPFIGTQIDHPESGLENLLQGIAGFGFVDTIFQKSEAKV